MSKNYHYIAISEKALSDRHSSEGENAFPAGESAHYYILPVTERGEHETIPLMQKMCADTLDHSGTPQITTLDIPQLRHDGGKTAALKVTCPQLNYYSGLNVISRVGSFSAMVKQFHAELPAEPPHSPISESLTGMLSRVPDGPLNGVLVVSFDQHIAGSLAAEELARAGATVIKIEKPQQGDPKRAHSSQTAFNTFNAGKFSMTFDDTEQDRFLKMELLSLADVVIDNRSEKAQLRDQVLQTELTRHNKNGKPIVYCAISGFGRGAQVPAYDCVVQAASGMAELNGKLVAFPVIDMATGKEAALEISKHLFMRERMTPAQLRQHNCMRLDISMAAVALNMMANPIATYMDTGKLETSIVPFDLYEAKDGKIAIGVATDKHFATLCDILEAPDLKAFTTNTLRQQHRGELEARLHQLLKARPVAEWMKLFNEHEISASPVVSLPDALATHGHDLVKATTDGGRYITSATRSNVFPRNPHIGSAPAQNGDKEAVRELVRHLESQISVDPRALTHAVVAASDAPDKSFQQKYHFVDLHDLDFHSTSSNVPWANGSFFHIRKIGHVHARPAEQYEVVRIRHTNGFSTPTVAMKDDWVVTTSYGDQYLLAHSKFEKLYVPVGGKEGEYVPNPEQKPRKAIEVTEDIRFMSPWNDTTYIPKGGYIALGSNGPYGIHPNNIAGGDYEKCRWLETIEPKEKKWAKGA